MIKLLLFFLPEFSLIVHCSIRILVSLQINVEKKVYTYSLMIIMGPMLFHFLSNKKILKIFSFLLEDINTCSGEKVFVFWDILLTTLDIQLFQDGLLVLVI